MQRYKAQVFLLSSMYAGLAGVLYALSIGSVAPESFALDLSVLYLAMIVLGGLGSVGGAVLGALFVTALPNIFQEYAGALAFISQAGQGGVSTGQAARLLFGLTIVLVIMFEPGGLAGFGKRLTGRRRRPPGTVTTPAAPDPSHRPAQGSTP